MERSWAEATRAKETALEKMKNGDFVGALKFASRAQQLCPDLESITQIVLVCEVHCSARERVCDNDKNWYKILKIDPTADTAAVKKHCGQLVLGLHPDKNKFPGADEAFQLSMEAKTVLLNAESRRVYDSRCRSFSNSATAWADRLRGNVSKVDLGNGPSTSMFEKPKRGRKPKKGLPVDISDCKKKKPITTRKRGKFSKQETDANREEVSSFPGNQVSENPSVQINLEYSAPQFNDFDKSREKTCLKQGQIWAIYDTIDALPRFYALITDGLSKPFNFKITWLEPCPENKEEAKWLYEGLPASCGKFKLGESETIEDRMIFSHIVCWRKEAGLSDVYQIYPRKGETWALFQDWNMEWWMDPEKRKGFKFGLVEILSDYDCNNGVSIAFLDKVEGKFASVFSRSSDGCGLIEAKERLRFSHRVPSVQIKMEGCASETDVFLELDSAALPSNFV